MFSCFNNHIVEQQPQDSARNDPSFVRAGKFISSAPFILKELQTIAFDAELARKHAALLADISMRLSSSLELEINLARTVQLTIPLLGDWCFIDLFNDHGILERAQVAHSNPNSVILAKNFKDVVNHSFESVYRQSVIDTKKLISLSNIFLEVSIRDLRIDMIVRSIMIVPILLRDDLFGVLTFFVTDEAGDQSSICKRYDDVQVRLVEEIAYRFAIALDNSRNYSQAINAVVARDLFFSIVSHELKTPLTAISLQNELLSLLLKNSDFSETHIEKMGSILKSAKENIQQLSRMVNELLDTSSIHQANFSIDLKAIDLAEVVLDVVNYFSNQFRNDTAKIRIAHITPCIAMFDRDRMKQVLSNLLTNARKYAPNSDVLISLQDLETYIDLRVQDFGPGISKEDQLTIFQKYGRVRSMIGKVEGFGLGLYIVEQIIIAHRGSIHIESELNKGTTFHIHIPKLRN